MLKKVIREKDKEKLDMNVFKELGKDLNYKDILQVDGAFSACHINYGKSLLSLPEYHMISELR